MTKVKNLLPEISRPGEYVAFVNFVVPTKEGPVFVFIGVDGFSEFAFNISVERDASHATVIKAVYLLTENKDFALHMNKGFTLVFDKWEELSERIEAIVKPVNGKILFSTNLHKKIAAPLVSSFNDFAKKGPKR